MIGDSVRVARSVGRGGERKDSGGVLFGWFFVLALLCGGGLVRGSFGLIWGRWRRDSRRERDLGALRSGQYQGFAWFAACSRSGWIGVGVAAAETHCFLFLSVMTREV